MTSFSLDEAKEAKLNLSVSERGWHVRKTRKRLGISLRTLAELGGVSVSSLSRYESGKCDISAKAIARLINVLHDKHVKKELAAHKAERAKRRAERKAVRQGRPLLTPEEGKVVFSSLAKGSIPLSSLLSANPISSSVSHLPDKSPKRVPLSSLMGVSNYDSYVEHCEKMRREYGPHWREVFRALLELSRKNSDLEKRIAELRDLLQLETAAVLLESEKDELREKIKSRESE